MVVSPSELPRKALRRCIAPFVRKGYGFAGVDVAEMQVAGGFAVGLGVIGLPLLPQAARLNTMDGEGAKNFFIFIGDSFHIWTVDQRRPI